MRKGDNEQVRTTKVHEVERDDEDDTSIAEAWAEYEEWRRGENRDEEK